MQCHLKLWTHSFCSYLYNNNKNCGGGPPFHEYFSKKYFFFKGWLPLVFGIYICEKLEYKMTPAYIGGREAVFQILMILRPASIY